MAFFLFGAGSLVVGLMRSGFLLMGSINASRGMHNTLLARVVRLPMSFFDSQPTGRLLNRFTKDTEAVDLQVRCAWGGGGAGPAGPVGGRPPLVPPRAWAAPRRLDIHLHCGPSPTSCLCS
jgi:hypothetical protein